MSLTHKPRSVKAATPKTRARRPLRVQEAASPLPPWSKARGRGAGIAITGRFEPGPREAQSDGWDIRESAQPLRTEVALERPRRVITRNSSPDIPFDRSLNPYRGCEHGCIYCYARPTHAWLGLSPGLDFESRLIARPDAPAQLERELRAPGYTVRPIVIGTATDPYQPIEATHHITRSVLEVLRDFRHPAVILTRGTLIERDLDILAPMARAGLMRVGVSLTTLDAELSRRLEPRAPAPARRLQMVRALARARVPVRAMISPLIPALTDHEIEALLAAAVGAGAQCASWVLLRLPHEVAPLFRDWLARHVPGRADAVMRRMASLHAGQVYDPAWGQRMQGSGPHADLLHQRFTLACRRLGLARRGAALDCSAFSPPPRKGDQLSLF